MRSKEFQNIVDLTKFSADAVAAHFSGLTPDQFVSELGGAVVIIPSVWILSIIRDSIRAKNGIIDEPSVDPSISDV